MPGSAPNDIRHPWPDRLFHWTMAVLVIVLMGTAFLPILGLRFDWVPTHWVSGVLLTFAIVFHLYRVFWVHGIQAMTPTGNDLRSAIRKASEGGLPKYDLYQKLYHWSVAAVVLVLVITGCVMLLKIDTPLWRRDPSIISERGWGLVYVGHGAASMLLIFFFILHVYFAFLPEHRRLLAAMVLGRETGGPGRAPEHGA